MNTEYIKKLSDLVDDLAHYFDEKGEPSAEEWLEMKLEVIYLQGYVDALTPQPPLVSLKK